MADTPKDTRSGMAHFGSKDLKYLKKVSRQAVEKHTDTSVLYFEVDYENSHRNFYGEMLAKQFTNAQGTEIRGVIELNQSDTITLERVPNKLTSLVFSCYLDHLKELTVEPRIGDYFTVKNRWYMIYDRTILDANKVAIAVDREAIHIEYQCVEADDEEMLPEVHGKENRGSSDDIIGRIEPQV